jgi:hypothetical protein
MIEVQVATGLLMSVTTNPVPSSSWLPSFLSDTGATLAAVPVSVSTGASGTRPITEIHVPFQLILRLSVCTAGTGIQLRVRPAPGGRRPTYHYNNGVSLFILSFIAHCVHRYGCP